MKRRGATMLFVGHGTRLERGMHLWHRFVDDVVKRVGLSEHSVARAFVEIARPDVTEALVALARAGVRRVHGVPLLLFSAGHMQVDLPEAVARAEERVGRLDITWSSPFGDEPAFIDVAVDRATEIAARMPEGAGVVLVGRGNRDEGAQRAFAEVAAQVASRMGAPLVHGYLAGTGRKLEDALEELWRRGCRHIAVVPYLWFPGLLTEGLPERVNRWRGARDISFQVADPLGRDPRLVALVAERVRPAAHGLDVGTLA
ncbi:sirohydrochlorin chelatase [Alicyclobacillus sendaiensis]|uniref:sirohydrochlorin chelatase n=1 Tax=Alicyclobacillus sendaiensis TaxID=192387 RepID=UPI0026F42996|nr:sirohydrochlorin chelatase [Alicyclobacillus sendaiensis]